MINIKILPIIFSFSLIACGQKSDHQKINPYAVRLNDRAISLSPYLENRDSSSKAIALLDSATALDSNYFLGYYNKIMFYNQLKQYDKAIIAINQMIRLRPNSYLYSTGGIFYDKMGDSISSRNYFQKSLVISTKILDTMNVQNKAHNAFVINRALNLIMLGQQTYGNSLLRQVYESQTDSSQKEWTHSFMNKSKDEIIEMISNPATGEAKASAAPRSDYREAEKLTVKSKNKFNIDSAFKILSSDRSITAQSSERDTSMCNGWTISRNNLYKIIRHSKLTGGTEWDLSFDVLPCIIKGQLKQKGQLYNFEVNGGSWLYLKSKDTTVILGDYNPDDQKYFIQAPMQE
jgi:tetratricopeptide (TPR) repeat protein